METSVHLVAVRQVEDQTRRHCSTYSHNDRMTVNQTGKMFQQSSQRDRKTDVWWRLWNRAEAPNSLHSPHTQPAQKEHLANTSLK